MLITIKSNAYEAFYIAMQDVEEIIEIYVIVMCRVYTNLYVTHVKNT